MEVGYVKESIPKKERLFVTSALVEEGKYLEVHHLPYVLLFYSSIISHYFGSF